MKKTVLSVLKYCLLLGVGAALLLLAFKGANINSIFTEIKHANLLWLGLSVFVSLLAFVSRAYRWNLLIEPLGYKLGLKNTTAAVCFGYLANLAVPRLGEVSRCGALTGAEKIPFEKLLGTVIVERIVDVLTLLFAIVLMIVVQLDKVKSLILAYQQSTSGGSSNKSVLLYVIGGIIILLIAASIYLFKSKPSSKIVIKTRALIKGIIEGVKSVRNIRSFPLFIFHSIFIWTMYYLMAYFGFFALGATSGLGWQAALVVLVAGGIGMSAPSPGGFGTYHLLVSQALFIYGLEIDHGRAFATLLHGSQVLTIILTGAIGYLYLWLGNRKRKNADA